MKVIEELIENARTDLDKLNSMPSHEHRAVIISNALANTDNIHSMLQRARVFSGYTQAELAKKLKYKSAQFVSNWERGIALPPNKAWVRLSVLLNIPTQVIINQLRQYHVGRLATDLAELENDLKATQKAE
jgi:ribosome-binding protein aMBF1 (putative translation factor)